MLCGTREEVRQILISDLFKGIARGSGNASAIAITTAVLVTYYLTQHELPVSKVFRTYLYCTILQDVGLKSLPKTVQHLGQLFRSLERIEVGLTNTRLFVECVFN